MVKTNCYNCVRLIYVWLTVFGVNRRTADWNIYRLLSVLFCFLCLRLSHHSGCYNIRFTNYSTCFGYFCSAGSSRPESYNNMEKISQIRMKPTRYYQLRRKFKLNAAELDIYSCKMLTLSFYFIQAETFNQSANDFIELLSNILCWFWLW